MKTPFTFLLLTGITLQSFAQSIEEKPNWPKVKCEATIHVLGINEFYSTPFRLDHNLPGTEDSPHITKDGLRLYCMYMPTDQLALDIYVFATQDGAAYCNWDRWRRGQVGLLDFQVPPCPNPQVDSFLHSDIIYAERTSVKHSFGPWKRTGIANTSKAEVAPFPVQGNSMDGLERLYFNVDDSPNNNNNIYYLENCSFDLSSNLPRVPSTLNEPNASLDNPYFTKVFDDATETEYEIAFFDSENKQPFNGNRRDLWYTVKDPAAGLWQPPARVNTVNTGFDEAHAFIWLDESGIEPEYWLYYTGQYNRGTRIEPIPANAIFRARQTIKNNWDSWDKPEIILQPGRNVGAIGEPSITSEGDLCFLVYYDAGPGFTDDRFDGDVFYMSRKGSGSDGFEHSPCSVSMEGEEQPWEPEISATAQGFQVMLNQEVPTQVLLKVYSKSADLIFDDQTDQLSFTVDASAWEPGQYYVQLIDTNGREVSLNWLVN